MSQNARRVLKIGLCGLAGLLAGLLAVSPAVVAEQPGWDWSAPSRNDSAVPPSGGAPASDSPKQGRISEAVSSAGTDGQPGQDSGNGAAVDSGVAGAISSIMQPNRGPALSNDAEIEALRRRAQTGQPLPR